jgi:transposase
MRQERTVQASLFDLFAEHEIGRELKAMSQRLDEHRELIGLAAQDLCHDEKFRAWVEQFLVPELRKSDVVILDNLSSHEVAGVRTAIETAGDSLLYLPSYSPDLNLIAQWFAKLKASLRKAAARTFDAHRQRARNLHPGRMRKLPRKLRISTPIMKML